MIGPIGLKIKKINKTNKNNNNKREEEGKGLGTVLLTSLMLDIFHCGKKKIVDKYFQNLKKK